MRTVLQEKQVGQNIFRINTLNCSLQSFKISHNSLPF